MPRKRLDEVLALSIKYNSEQQKSSRFKKMQPCFSKKESRKKETTDKNSRINGHF